MRGHIRPRGKSSWQLKFEGPRHPDGKRNIQFATFRGTKSEAKVKLTELMAAVDKGTFIEPSKLTVGAYVLERITQWQTAGNISPRTAEGYRELADNQIAPHIGGALVQKLKTIDVESWHTSLRVSGRKDRLGGVSARTIGAAHRLLSEALDDAVRHQIVASNPARLQRPPRLDGGEVVILTEGRVAEMIEKLRRLAMFARAITAYGTGLRVSELLALRWCNVDIDGERMIRVREALEETKKGGIRIKKPKTKAGIRDITLPDLVVDTLREHRRTQLELRMALGLGKMPDEALVFPAADGGPQSPRSFSSKWSVVAARIGMPEITFHALRHTHASQLIAAGIDIVTISRRLGHASPAVTLAVYSHLFKKRDDKAAKAINDAVNAALPGRL